MFMVRQGKLFLLHLIFINKSLFSINVFFFVAKNSEGKNDSDDDSDNGKLF